MSELYQAPTKKVCETKRDELVACLKNERQEPAAATLLRDWDDFVTFYEFPQEHWLHLRTTNPPESVFAGMRLRTDVAKRARKRENALYLVFKVVQRLGRNWRTLNGGPALMQMVAEGAAFRDGVLQESDQETEVKVASSCRRREGISTPHDKGSRPVREVHCMRLGPESNALTAEDNK